MAPRVNASHAAVSGSIPGKVDWCEPSIVRNLSNYWFVAVILVKKSNNNSGELSEWSFTSVCEHVEVRPEVGWQALALNGLWSLGILIIFQKHTKSYVGYTCQILILFCQYKQNHSLLKRRTHAQNIIAGDSSQVVKVEVKSVIHAFLWVPCRKQIANLLSIGCNFNLFSVFHLHNDKM